MADMILGQPYGAGATPQEPSNQTDEQKQQEKALVNYLKALRDSSRDHTMKYMSRFHDAWLYAIGESRFPNPANQAAKQQEKHMARTVRNSMYAMMDHKVSYVTDPDPRVTMKPFDDIPEDARVQMEAVLESELVRGDWRSDGLEVAWDAEVGGLGFTMFYAKKDDLTGLTEICTKTADPSRTFVNKQATSLRPSSKGGDCMYVVHECEMSLADIRQKWPEQGFRVKPKPASPIGSDQKESYQGKTDDQIVQAPGNEFVVSGTGSVVEQEATITWAWEDNTELRSLWEESQTEEVEQGYECMDCGDLYLDSPGSDAGCPDCGSDNVAEVEIQPGSKVKRQMDQRVYPYGRCIIGVPSQGIILYEGPNDLPLERVFPLAMFRCYVKSRSFYGLGDYHLLKSNSKARDQLAGIAQDGVRYNAHPILEHPSEAEIYNTIGNGPGQKAAVESQYSGMARHLLTQSFDTNGVIVLDRMLDQDAKEITSVDEILMGGGPGPESGEAIKARADARGKRIGGYLDRYNEYLTDYAAIKWELMTKLYTADRNFTVKGPMNELKSITLNLSKLPFQFQVHVSADPEEVETNRVKGQVLAQFITSGQLFNPEMVPFLDDVLIGLGVDPGRAQNIQRKRAQQEMAKQAQGPPPPPPEPPSAILVAMSDILKAQPTFVTYDQVQQALAEAGIQPRPEQHPDALAARHGFHPLVPGSGEPADRTAPQAGPGQNGPAPEPILNGG